MARNEQHLLALILAGMGVLAASAVPESTGPATGEVQLGGTLNLGGMVVAIAACGDDDDTGEDDGPATSKEGRPFTVADETRTAPATPRNDWMGPADVDLAGLGAAQRSSLAHHFLRMAAAEHASVASFHRVALELLHLGAPPELLLESQQAAADEIRHAQVAYGLAERFSGHSQGPGSLDIRGALDIDLSPRGIMRRLIDEACVGETVSSLWMRGACQSAADPVLGALLCRVAQDEERHAALGWKTLAWLLRQHPELRREARSHIEEAFDRPWNSSTGDPVLERWGVLSTAARAELWERAFLQVILPAEASLGHG